MAGNGVVFDPPNQVPIGIWNTTTKTIDPAVSSVPGLPYATISYFGRTYLLMQDDRLVDPETEAVVGIFDRDTGSVSLVEPGDAADDIPIYDPVFDDGEPIHPSEYLERGRQSAKKGKYRAAACLYG